MRTPSPIIRGVHFRFLVCCFLGPSQLKFSNVGVSHKHDAAVTCVRFVDDVTVVTAARDNLLRVHTLSRKGKGKVRE